jgi:hypothetical protein
MSFRPMAGQLHPPRSPRRVGREVDTAARTGRHQPGELDAPLAFRRARGRCVRGLHLRRRLSHPGLRAVAGDDADIGLRLPRQAATAGEPCLDLGGAGIVGRRGQAQVATECRAQFAQVARRLAQRLQRLECVDEPPHCGGSGHELGDALRARRAHRRWVEAAFLPDQTGEELFRELVVGRRLGQRAADLGNEGRWILCVRLGRCVRRSLFACGGGVGTLWIGARRYRWRLEGGKHRTGHRKPQSLLPPACRVHHRMECRETVTMGFFPRTIAGLRPEQRRSHRSMTTLTAAPACVMSGLTMRLHGPMDDLHLCSIRARVTVVA